jgi:type IV secretory pathway VirB4 component
MVRLVDPAGDLGGMFAGTSTIDAADLDQLVVLDLSAIHRHHRHALPLVMTCAAAWLQTAVDSTTRGRFQVNDEAWALLSDPAIARWMQSNQKLARQLSLSVINVLHRLSDTAAVGDAGSAVRSLAEGVIADAGTWIIYRQKPAERDLLRDTLKLNDMQTDLVTRIGRGRGLWVVAGERRDVALVDHVLSDIERDIVDTDQNITSIVKASP